MQEKPLLILDLDETLVHACERDSEKDLRIRQHRQPDFFVGEYTIYNRPGVDEFLTRVYAVYQIAIWSKGGSGYVEPCVDELLKGFPAPVFVWSYRRCTRRFDHEAFEAYYIKDLKKVVKRGFAKERMLIVDDLPSNSERNFGNAVYIAPFEGEPEDAELEHLAAYLESLAPEPNFRTIEKRYWRHPRQE